MTAEALRDGVEHQHAQQRAWYDRVSFPANLRWRRSMLGDQHQVQLRISDDEGQFIGLVLMYMTELNGTTIASAFAGQQ